MAKTAVKRTTRTARPKVKKMAKTAVKRTTRTAWPYAMSGQNWNGMPNWTPSRTKKPRRKPVTHKTYSATPAKKVKVYRAKTTKRNVPTYRRKATGTTSRRKKW
jgi:hypothetical protein